MCVHVLPVMHLVVSLENIRKFWLDHVYDHRSHYLCFLSKSLQHSCYSHDKEYGVNDIVQKITDM